MNNDSKNLIASLVFISVFFIFPGYRSIELDTGNTLVVLLLGASGILLSRIFVLSSKSSDRTGIEPSILAFIASWQCSILIYPVVAFFAFTGSIINSIRSERSVGHSVTAAVLHGVSFAVLLRFGVFLYGSVSSMNIEHDAVGTYVFLTLTAMAVTVLRTILVYYTANSTGSLPNNLKRNIFANGFILLLAVPGTLAAENHPNTIQMLITLTVSLFAMVAVHGISISLNRSAHERTGELETVSTLKELSRSLSAAETETEVLRILSRSLSRAWQCRSSVRWKNLSFCEGEPWDFRSGVSFTHHEGLTVSVDSLNSTVPEYLGSFADRTVPVLIGLEAEKRVKKASWKSVETMISFLEENASEFAGFSRRTAATAEELCTALGKNNWFRDCVRLAALLHNLELPESGPSDSNDQTLTLPEITGRTLAFMHEHWCGTGPMQKQGVDIPLSSRILAVSIGWERAVQSGNEVAVRDLNMKAGTLYDPRLVEQLIELKS